MARARFRELVGSWSRERALGSRARLRAPGRVLLRCHSSSTVRSSFFFSSGGQAARSHTAAKPSASASTARALLLTHHRRRLVQVGERRAETVDLFEGRIPSPLQLSGHQAVARIHGVVLLEGAPRTPPLRVGGRAPPGARCPSVRAPARPGGWPACPAGTARRALPDPPTSQLCSFYPAEPVPRRPSVSRQRGSRSARRSEAPWNCPATAGDGTSSVNRKLCAPSAPPLDDRSAALPRLGVQAGRARGGRAPPRAPDRPHRGRGHQPGDVATKRTQSEAALP